MCADAQGVFDAVAGVYKLLTDIGVDVFLIVVIAAGLLWPLAFPLLSRIGKKKDPPQPEIDPQDAE